jgi:hypothetical protein
MTATVCIHLHDHRLTPEDRQKVLEISRKLYARDGGTAGAPPARKLPEAHHRVDRGDL